MTTILITGSNGLLGQKIIMQLLNNNEVKLIATSRKNNKLTASNKKYSFELLDITNEAEVNYIIEKHYPEIIINTAALTNVNQCEISKTDCWNTNVQGVDNLIHAANKVGAHLIHLSTDFIFDGTRGQYTEDDLPNPLNFYGLSKLESERNVSEKAKKWSIIRTILVYGVLEVLPRPSIVTWVKESLENNKPIKIINDQFRTPTLAENLAEACIEIAFKEKHGIYHISGNNLLSILEIAYQVADFFSLNKKLITPVSSVELNEIAKRPYRTGFILTKAQKDINYIPCSFEEGLKLIKKQLQNIDNSD